MKIDELTHHINNFQSIFITKNEECEVWKKKCQHIEEHHLNMQGMEQKLISLTNENARLKLDQENVKTNYDKVM